jgi:hypothetical protein
MGAGMKQQATEQKWTPEAKKGKRVGSPLDPPGGTGPLSP